MMAEAGLKEKVSVALAPLLVACLTGWILLDLVFLSGYSVIIHGELLQNFWRPMCVP